MSTKEQEAPGESASNKGKPSPQSPSGPANARGPTPIPAGMRRVDKEFLPAALEILESPPSPIRIAFMLTICAFVVGALAWSWFGRMDIVAIAQGKIQPTGRVKTVQPLEAGRVVAIMAVNGNHVTEGQVLVELDKSEISAELAGYEAGLQSSLAEIARRRAALQAGSDPFGERSGGISGAADRQDLRVQPVSTVSIEFPPETPAAIRQREQTVLRADISALAATLSALQSQRRQKYAERQRLAETITVQKDLVGTLKERVDMRSALVKMDSGSRSSVIDATEQLQYHQSQLAERRGQLLEAEAAAEAFASEIEKAIRSFIADNSQKLADAERQAEDFTQKVARVKARLSSLTLRAPITGVVQASGITSPGQVLTAGQEIMRVVPSGARLEIEAYLANKDIGFVTEGMEAAVKVESFPYTRYGTVPAIVTSVGRDAIPEPDARQMEGDPARTSETRGFAGAQRTQNLVFPVTLAPGRDTIEADGLAVALQPGMAVTVEIKTGSRRLISYVLSPLMEVSTEAMRER